MKLTFHDAPPPRHGGRRPINPKLVEFMDALKANPGKWAMFPDKISGYARNYLRKAGFEAQLRNAPKGSAGDLWASWPVSKRTEVRMRPNAKGANLICSDRDWTTAPEHVADLDRHCRTTHGRGVTKAERVPQGVAA